MTLKIAGFKIRDRTTGLYMMAGLKWSKHGKIWATLGHIRSALHYTDTKKKVPANWELIVLYEGAAVNADLIIDGGFSIKKLTEFLSTT